MEKLIMADCATMLDNRWTVNNIRTKSTFFDKMDFRTRDTEFDVIYVNGDNTLPQPTQG